MASPITPQAYRAKLSPIFATLFIILFGVFAASRPAIANTEVFVLTSATDMGLTNAYSGAALPGTNNDVVFASGSTYASGTNLIFTNNLSFGSLDDLTTTGAILITASGSKTLTLNGGSNSVGGTANDTVYVASGASMNVNSATTLVAAGTAYYFDAASSGTLAIGGTATSGLTYANSTGNGAINFNGAGIVMVNGTNTFNASGTNAILTLTNSGGGNVTFTGPVELTEAGSSGSSSNLVVNAAAGPMTFDGIRSGGNSQGSSITFEGGNSITINSGNAGAFGSGGLIEANNNITFAVTEMGAGTVVKLDAGASTTDTSPNWSYTLNAGTTLDFGAAAAIQSNLIINGGTIDNTSGGSISAFVSSTPNQTTINGNFTWNGSQTLILNGTANLGIAAGTSRTITGNAGAGILEITGSISNGTTANQLIFANGAFELGGTNSSYTGGTILQSGTLISLANNAFGTGGITLGMAAGTAPAKLLINGGTNSASITTTAGDTQTLTVGNSAATTVTAGGLVTLNTNLQVTQASGGSINFTGGFAGSSTASNPATATFNPTGSISAGMIADGASSLGVTATGSGITYLTGSNTYSGATLIGSGGLLELSSTAALSPNTLVTVNNNATLAVSTSGANPWTTSNITALLGSSAVTFNSGASIGFDAGSGSFTYSPNLSGNIGVTAVGGTITLAGTDTFTGPVTVISGILVYSNSNAFDIGSGLTETAANTTVQIEGGINSASGNTITLDGTGLAGVTTGALESVSGSNTIGNPISSSGVTTISSDSGSLTLTGNIINTGHTVFLNSTGGAINIAGGTFTNVFSINNEGAGTGVTTISDNIGSGVTNGVTESSTSSLLILSGSNSYTGLTSIASGATLQFDGYPSVSSTSSISFSNNGTAVFLADTSGTFAPISVVAASNVSTVMNLDVGPLTTASNNTVTISGTIFSPGGSTALANVLNVTASNGYIVTLSGGLNLPSSGNGFTYGLNASAGTVLNTGSIALGSFGQTLTVGGNGTVNISNLGFGSNSTSTFVVGNGSSSPDVTIQGNTFSFSNRTTGGFSVAVNSGILNLNASSDVSNIDGSTTFALNGGTLNLNVANDLTNVSTFTITGGTLNNLGATANAGAGESGNAINGDFAWSGSNSLTLNSSSSLGGAGSVRTITTGGTGILIFTSAISGSDALAENGSGILQLNGADTYTGGFNLNGGELAIDNAKALGTGTFTINGGGMDNFSGASLSPTNNVIINSNFSWFGTNTVFLTGSSALSGSSIAVTTAGTAPIGLSGVVSGSAQLSENGSGILNLGAANTYTGGFVLNSGQVSVNNAGAFGTGGFTINGGTVDNTHGSTVTATNSVQINNNFAWNGSNQLLLSGPAAMSGTSIVATTAGSSALDLTGILSGSAQLTVSGTGTLALNGANTYTGGTVVNGGILQIGTGGATENAGALSTGTVTLNGGELLFAPGSSSTVFNIANSMVLNSGTIDGGDGLQHIATGAGATINITGSGGTVCGQYVNKSLYLDGQLTGSGPLTVENFAIGSDGDSITHITNNSNTYSGVLTLQAGAVVGARLEVDGSNALQFATVNVVGTEGTFSGLNWGTTTPMLGALEGNGNFSLVSTSLTSVALTVGGNNANTTYSGLITNGTSSVNGSLTKVGAGTMILSGSGAYTGGTIINQGALIVSGSLSGTVSDSGTFGGSGAVGGLVTVNQNGVIEPGALDTTVAGATLTLNGGLTLAGTSSLVINLDSSNNIDALAITGNLTLGSNDTLTLNLLSGATLDQPSYTIATVSGVISGGFANTNLPANYAVETVGDTLELVAVPEPGTVGIVLAGFGMLVGIQRWRRVRVGS